MLLANTEIFVKSIFCSFSLNRTDVNVEDRHGLTPLHYLALADRAQVDRNPEVSLMALICIAYMLAIMW